MGRFSRFLVGSTIIGAAAGATYFFLEQMKDLAPQTKTADGAEPELEPETETLEPEFADDLDEGKAEGQEESKE